MVRVIFITDSIEAGDQNQPTVCRGGPAGFVNIAGVQSPLWSLGSIGVASELRND